MAAGRAGPAGGGAGAARARPRVAGRALAAGFAAMAAEEARQADAAAWTESPIGDTAAPPGRGAEQ